MGNLFLTKKIEEKTIVWFKKNNQYIVVEDSVAFILNELNNDKSIDIIAESLSKKIAVPYDASLDFVNDIHKDLYLPNIKEEVSINNKKNVDVNCSFFNTKFYKIKDIVFKVEFETEYEEYLIHPKFSHLTIKEQDTYNFYYQVFTKEDLTYLIVDGITIGTWNEENIHYFQGKFSMMMIQSIYKKEESEWMGVFHASAVSNGDKSALFLGDSGNGKSTSLALLQANGFSCLADDFVPIDIEKKEVYSFPAAISIKKNSLPVLLPMYPELKTSAEYHFKTLNKIVRFLEPNNEDFLNHLPCNDLIFIKYEKGSPILCNKISKIAAFEQLIPDSWLSPIEENVQIFLDWFENLNCYQLTYSVNEEMISTVTKIYNNEL